MTAPRVFVTRRIPAAGLERLAAAAAVEVWADELPPPRATLLDKVRDCDGLLTMLTDRVDAELLAAAPRLRVVANLAVGYDNIDVPACAACGVAVGNTPGALTESTADAAVALLLAAARRLVEADRFARSGAWRTWDPLGHLGQEVFGKTLGVVGLGRIGFAAARRLARGWDMPVLYLNRRANEWTARARAEFDARPANFDELLARSDFVTVHASFNSETKGMFSAAAFRRMKPTAVFVNTARGGLVVQADLVAALRSGALFAAGLDVTDPEPPDPADPLLTLDNVVVLPHIASATIATRTRIAEMAADNILAGLAGRPLPTPVTIAGSHPPLRGEE